MNLKSFNVLTEFWHIIRELNPDTIEREASQPFRIVVVGPDDERNQAVAGAFVTGKPGVVEVVQTVNVSSDGNADSLPRADLYVYALPSEEMLDVEHAHRVSAIEVRGRPVLLTVCNAGDRENAELLDIARYTFTTLPSHRIVVVRLGDEASVASKLIPAIIASLPHLHLSIARTLPTFRDVVAANLISETSRVNGEFALLSSVPGSIPLVGELFATGADMLVLTKNQIMLVLKIATIYGRNHDSKVRTLAEIAPVVGGAFLWRTTARTLVGLFPGFVAALPKALVAFAGTFVVGSIAKYYYRTGVRPTRKALEQFYEDALLEARALFGDRRARNLRRSSEEGVLK